MASIPEFDDDAAADAVPEEMPYAEFVSNLLMGHVKGAFNPPDAPGIYLEYADGSVVHLIADAKAVHVKLLAAPNVPVH